MNQELSEALNDCLDRLIQGESIQECLSLYPQHANELEPLLQVAFATMRAADTVNPSPAAKASNFQRFNQAVAESRDRSGSANRPGAGRDGFRSRARFWSAWWRSRYSS